MNYQYTQNDETHVIYEIIILYHMYWDTFGILMRYRLPVLDLQLFVGVLCKNDKVGNNCHLRAKRDNKSLCNTA